MPEVFIGMPCNRDMPPETVSSLLRTVSALSARGIRHCVRFELGMSIVEKARMCVMHEFLKSNFDSLFWVDSDMAWMEDGFLRMLQKTQKLGVVAGIATFRREPLSYCFQPWHTPEIREGCVRVKSAGFGFICMTRGVCQAVADSCERGNIPDIGENVPITFRVAVSKETGLLQGEDVNFCEDVNRLGYGIWADPAVVLGHVGAKVYSGPGPFKKE